MRLFVFLMLLSFFEVKSQYQLPDSMKTIKVHFLYGSKPRKEYRFVEKNYFGGLHGGHVSIEVENEVIGFGPRGKFHVFGRHKHFHSCFSAQPFPDWFHDTTGMQYTSLAIPVTATQYEQLTQIHDDYRKFPPYDYAFIGMRCAAATYDVLSQIGIMPKHSRHWMVMHCFYPRLLRRKMLQLAQKRHYKVSRTKGRSSRQWEKE